MSTMNISLPEELKAYVDIRIKADGFGSSSEYMRELIRRDRDRERFRQYLLDGIASKPAGRMDAAYFAEFGERLPIDESYRDYDTQVLYRQLYGAYAAVPGTSNHGWAAAIDLPDHRFADDRAYSWFGHTDGWTFDGEKYLWLRANGPALGWVHPRAMEPGGGGPQEPWHFEWAPGTA